jgi:hypothetical protein
MMRTLDLSLEHQVALLPEAEREAVLSDMDDDALAALEYDWSWFGRPSQLLPAGGDAHWTLALALAGRGFG